MTRSKFYSSIGHKTNDENKNFKSTKSAENHNLLESNAVDKITTLNANDPDADIINLESNNNCCLQKSNDENNEALIVFQSTW